MIFLLSLISRVYRFILNQAIANPAKETAATRFFRETLIQSLSDFTLEFLCIARNHLTRIASYLRKVMTFLCIKIFGKIWLCDWISVSLVLSYQWLTYRILPLSSWQASPDRVSFLWQKREIRPCSMDIPKGVWKKSGRQHEFPAIRAVSAELYRGKAIGRCIDFLSVKL